MDGYTLSILCLNVLIVESQMESPIVSTLNGNVFGQKIHFYEDKYLNYSGYFNHFKGIPYAQPPVGRLRFRPPVPVEQWTDVYNATYYRSDCPQRMNGFETSLIEDCLYLNVLVPANNVTKAPVMVWIHGGQFSFGGGADERYSGVPLMAAAGGKIIYVRINYRLGVFGFLTTGNEVAAGNFGLMDQAMALTWIKENIEAFGGDPEKVTIFGLGAGAGSVSAHLLNASNDDLFQGAILQSGSMFESDAMIELNMSRAVDANRQVATKLGCETKSAEKMVECMRSAIVDDILTASQEVRGMYPSPQRSSAVFIPVVDSTFIPSTPRDLIGKGNFKKVDTILGTNRDETVLWLNQIFDRDVLSMEESPFLNKTHFKNLLHMAFPDRNELYIDSIEQEYTDWKHADDPWYNYLQSWIQISTDELYQCPTDVTARALAIADQNVFRYFNTHVPSRYTLSMMSEPEWNGVPHLQEAQFVFGYHFNPYFEFLQTEEEIRMSIKAMRYWINFAKTGNPNMADEYTTNVDEAWPRFTVPGLEYKVFSPEMENKHAVDANECSFWFNYSPKLSLFTEDISELEEDWRNSYYDWKYVALNEWNQVFEEYKAESKPCP